MHSHLVPRVVMLGKITLHAFGADSDVLPPSFHDVFGHFLDAFWAVDLNWSGTPDNPRREDEVWVSNSVVGVQVRDEGDFEG